MGNGRVITLCEAIREAYAEESPEVRAAQANFDAARGVMKEEVTP